MEPRSQGVLTRLVGSTLPGPDQLHVMVVAAQTFDQPGQRQGHAIDFRWIGFCHHRHAPGALLGVEIVNLELGVCVCVHQPMLAALDNKMMTRLFSDMKHPCHASFTFAR